jgi:uncharacterized membrane protein
MLVTGIFWGPWFSLHRSLQVFKPAEFIHIVKTLADNLAFPMRIMMPGCILFMLLSLGLYPQKNSAGFYLHINAFALTVIALLVTLLVEVPIVNRIKQWQPETIPQDWEAIRNRWVKFHVFRTFASLLSFASFAASVLFF